MHALRRARRDLWPSGPQRVGEDNTLAAADGVFKAQPRTGSDRRTRLLSRKSGGSCGSELFARRRAIVSWNEGTRRLNVLCEAPRPPRFKEQLGACRAVGAGPRTKGR